MNFVFAVEGKSQKNVAEVMNFSDWLKHLYWGPPSTTTSQHLQEHQRQKTQIQDEVLLAPLVSMSHMEQLRICAVQYPGDLL